MATGMDYLVVGNYILDKRSQHSQANFLNYVNQFDPD
jgi:hypothetical protein